jgi:hypothetical protein
MFWDVLVRPAGHREKEKWVPPHHTEKPIKNECTHFQEEYLYKYRMHLNFVHGHILSRFHKKLRYGADFQKKVGKKR